MRSTTNNKIIVVENGQAPCTFFTSLGVQRAQSAPSRNGTSPRLQEPWLALLCFSWPCTRHARSCSWPCAVLRVVCLRLHYKFTLNISILMYFLTYYILLRSTSMFVLLLYSFHHWCRIKIIWSYSSTIDICHYLIAWPLSYEIIQVLCDVCKLFNYAIWYNNTRF